MLEGGTDVFVSSNSLLSKEVKIYIDITLLLDGGSAETDRMEVVYEQSYQLPVPVRVGYTFIGWTLAGEVFDTSGIWTVDANVIVKAVWERLPSKEVTVTFVQEGQTSIVYKVEQGAVLSQIPVPAAKQGYTVTWEVDMRGIEIWEDQTVRAVEIPNQYVIRYDLSGIPNATISSTTQTVTFDAKYSLYKPSAKGYTFIGWKLKDTNMPFTDGIYSIAGNVELVAIWQEDLWSEFH